jgi:hypothetical protein
MPKLPLKLIVALVGFCLLAGGYEKPALAGIISQHAAYDGTLRTSRTFLGYPFEWADVVEVKESQTRTSGFKWTTWGRDVLRVYQALHYPGWSATQQIAVYDTASPVGNMGSIRDLLIDGGYWANGDHLYMPAFGPFDVSDPNAPSLYTAIDVGEWIMGGATYDFYGNYSFTDGYTSSLPGIRVATSPWLWDPDYPGGWTVSSASDLFTGGAIVAFETNGAVVPEPSSWLLFAGGASSLLLIRRRRRSAHLCEASVA